MQTAARDAISVCAAVLNPTYLSEIWTSPPAVPLRTQSDCFTIFNANCQKSMKTRGFELSIRQKTLFSDIHSARAEQTQDPQSNCQQSQHGRCDPTRPHIYQTLVRITYNISHIGEIIHENAQNNENNTQATVLRHLNSPQLFQHYGLCRNLYQKR